MNITTINRTMSSREIADLAGKRHDHVMRDIERLNESYEKLAHPRIGVSDYKDSTGRTLKCYALTKMQTLDLMTGYRAELRIKVNRRWEELEKQNQASELAKDPLSLLKLAVSEIEQRDQTIATLQPKAELMDRVIDSEQHIDIGQAAKLLALPFGRNTLFKKLREKGVFFKNRNEPKQELVKRGYFLLKEQFIECKTHQGFVVLKVLVTQKGLGYLSKLFDSQPAARKLAFMS